MNPNYELKDISMYETRSLVPSQILSELSYFWGKATCIDISKIVFQSKLDKNKLKTAISDLSINDYNIILFYTGHSDRFYNTSMWDSARTLITPSALKYLSDLSIKNIGIDSPFFLGQDFNLSESVLTLGLHNIGHLCGKDFLYMGFPIISDNSRNSFSVRATALKPNF